MGIIRLRRVFLVRQKQAEHGSAPARLLTAPRVAHSSLLLAGGPFKPSVCWLEWDAKQVTIPATPAKVN